MRNSHILICFLFLLGFSGHSIGQEVRVKENKNGEKSWLVNSKGKRISKKYAKIYPLFGVSNLNPLELHYFKFFSKSDRYKSGVLDQDGEVVIEDTISGEVNYLDSKRFFSSWYDNREHFVVFDLDGHIDSAYSENLVYIADDALIKERNERFAVFTLENVQITEFIYFEFDTGDFLRRHDPPILVYMTLGDGKVHAVGFDGEIISVYDPNSPE